MRFPLVVAIVVIISFVVFQPRIPNYLFTNSRDVYLNRLVTSTVSSNHLDPQKYWETREFYFPGFFHVYQDGLTDANILDFSTQTGISPEIKGTFPILVYSSPKWHSYESLVNSDKLSDIVKLPESKPIYEDSETKIYKEGNKTLFFFIKSYEELKVTNGFIYTKDAILKNYRYWFGVSVVTR